MLSETIVPAKCSNFEYGLPSGHTMGFMTVIRTLSRLIEDRGQLPIIQGLSLIMVCFVSYNRAVQQVHSFDQLLDGFVMGLILSEFLTERSVRRHFRDFVDDMQYMTKHEVLFQPICVVFYLL